MKINIVRFGSLLLAGVVLAFALVWGLANTVSAAELASHDETGVFDAADLTPYRWHVLDRDIFLNATSGAISLDLTSLDAADISAYRWNAMGRFYLSQATSALDLTTLNAADISAYRWNAMAKFYESQGALTRDPSSMELSDDFQSETLGERLYTWPGH
jgi:hypothetical protein